MVGPCFQEGRGSCSSTGIGTASLANTRASVESWHGGAKLAFQRTVAAAWASRGTGLCRVARVLN